MAQPNLVQCTHARGHLSRYFSCLIDSACHIQSHSTAMLRANWITADCSAYPPLLISYRRQIAVAGEGGAIRLSDMLEGLGDARASLGASRKLIERLDRKAAPVDAPLPRSIRERVERKAGYEHTSKDVTKWQPIVKVGVGGSSMATACLQRCMMCDMCRLLLHHMACTAQLAKLFCHQQHDQRPTNMWYTTAYAIVWGVVCAIGWIVAAF